MDYFIDTGLVDHSSVAGSSNYETCHAIEPKVHQSTSTSLQELFNLLALSTPLLASFLITSLFYLLSAFLFALVIKKFFQSSDTSRDRFQDKSQDLSQTIRMAPDRRNSIADSFLISQFQSNLMLLKRSEVARILVVSYVLFMFFVQTMLSMNINTEVFCRVFR